jgi:hypothetical protein
MIFQNLVGNLVEFCELQVHFPVSDYERKRVCWYCREQFKTGELRIVGQTIDGNLLMHSECAKEAIRDKRRREQ